MINFDGLMPKVNIWGKIFKEWCASVIQLDNLNLGKDWAAVWYQPQPEQEAGSAQRGLGHYGCQVRWYQRK